MSPAGPAPFSGPAVSIVSVIQTGSQVFTVTWSAPINPNYALIDNTAFTIGGNVPTGAVANSSTKTDIQFGAVQSTPVVWVLNHQPAWLPINQVTGATTGITA